MFEDAFMPAPSQSDIYEEACRRVLTQISKWVPERIDTWCIDYEVEVLSDFTGTPTVRVRFTLLTAPEHIIPDRGPEKKELATQIFAPFLRLDSGLSLNIWEVLDDTVSDYFRDFSLRLIRAIRTNTFDTEAINARFR